MKGKISLILLIFVFSLYGNIFQTPTKGNGELVSKGNKNKWCPYCGMDLIKFFKTNTYIILEDNSRMQFCSFHCLVSSKKNNVFKKDELKGIFAVDADTDSFHPVKQLNFVVGSKIPGTMTKTSKYSFISNEKAVLFTKKNGGEIRTFEETFNITKKNLLEDEKRINIKRERMMFPMGKKIYEKICDKEALKKIKYKSLNQLKSEIEQRKLCGKLNGKQLQAITLYLALKENIKRKQILDIPRGSKCPVCGMFVYKYPKWASMIVLGSGKKLYFDGAKDLFKFYFRPDYYLKSKTTPIIKKIVLKDYYTAEIIDGRKSYYVIGSDIYGPMGNELIPHKSMESAMIFFKDHKGKKILSFSKINRIIIESLDN